jgi:hypothetical protein
VMLYNFSPISPTNAKSLNALLLVQPMALTPTR